MAKATGIPLAKIAARVIAGAALADLRARGRGAGGRRPLPDARTRRGEGRSPAVRPVPRRGHRARPGDALDRGGDRHRSPARVALAKAQEATGVAPPARRGTVFVSAANRDKRAIVLPVRRLAELGFTHARHAGHRLGHGAARHRGRLCAKRSEGSPDAVELIEAGGVQTGDQHARSGGGRAPTGTSSGPRRPSGRPVHHHASRRDGGRAGHRGAPLGRPGPASRSRSTMRPGAGSGKADSCRRTTTRDAIEAGR